MKRILAHRLARFARDDRGAAMVEFALVAAVFFFTMFSIFDIGRLAYTSVGGESAVRLAARLAIVRPPACTAVPERNVPPANTTPGRYGLSCKGGLCASVSVSCTGAMTGGSLDCGSAATIDSTAEEIWCQVRPLLPSNATIGDLRFTYASRDDLGYLGGPFVPMVTVSIAKATGGLTFNFISPLSSFVTLFGGSGFATSVTLPVYSVTLPGEDLALGENG